MYAVTTSRPQANNPSAAAARTLSTNSAIFDAARSRAWTAVHLLLAQLPGTFDGRDPVGNTLSYFLVYAASNGITDAFHDLQNLIAENKLPTESLSEANQFGKTPLHLLAEHFNADIWKFLVDHGADPQQKDNDHQSPLDILEARNPDAADWLRQRSFAQLAAGHVDMRSENDCSICLFAINIKGDITPCGHKFHIECIRPWINNNSETNKTCPNCKSRVNLEQLQLFIPDDNAEMDQRPSAPPSFLSAVHERDLPETTRTRGVEETKTEEPPRLNRVQGINRVQAQASLENAVKSGDINLLRQILRVRGVDINAKDNRGESALYFAAREGKTEATRLLLDARAEINIINRNGITPAKIAAYCGHVDALTLLADRGADINGRGCRSPAYFAAEQGHVDALALLADRRADLNKADDDDRTPAYVAAENGHVDALTLLADYGADINKASRFGTPAYAAAKNGHVNALALLADCGADLNKANKSGDTPACAAAENGHVAALNLLADLGIDLNSASGNREKTPAYFAATNGHVAALTLLAERGADLNKASGYFDSTPAYLAAENGHVDALIFLADRGAELDKVSGYREKTPAYVAAKNGHVAALTLLADRRADLNKQNRFGKTPAYTAAKYGHIDVLTLLADRRADLNKESYNPASAAAGNGRVDALTLLADRGADLSKGSYTPAYAAAENGHVNTLNLLAERGADLNKAGKWGTPAYAAADNRHVAALKVLAQNGVDLKAVISSIKANPILHPIRAMHDRQDGKKTRIIAQMRSVQKEVARENSGAR